MKFSPIFSVPIILLAMAGLTYGQDKMIVGPNDLEIQFIDKNCWVDIFEDTDFDVDDPHVRVVGPIQAATLEHLGGQNWNDEIQSLIVGPNAMVQAYKDRDFSGTEVVFVSNQRMNELAELDMSDDIESLKVQCGNG